ncbi:MAG TPA: long-chain fatty acid--CoA ligase [Chitinophagaceae bacterium]|nr:long-chain fatty acid--CoA ligase [Chitinophagaceae bacterium]
MATPQRLFDCIHYQLETSPLPNMLAAKENGKWRTYSTQEVKEIVDKLSGGLLNLGISCGDMTPEGRDKVAILSKNRPEWIMLDLAVQQIGALLTPLYPTINVNELEYILNDAGVKIIFVNDEETFLKVVSIKDRVPSLKNIFTFEYVPNGHYWKEVLALSTTQAVQQIPAVAQKVQYKDLVTIIYTSGTTGKPKGVLLSHENILSNVMAAMACFPTGDKQRSLSFLPLNHILERMVNYLYLFSGTAIYYAESLDTIGENLKEIKPHMFVTVPRLLEKVYDKIMMKGSELTGIKRKLFFWAHELATKFEINKNQGAVYNLQLAIANKLVFSKWREALGGNIRCIVAGGAACQVRLIRIFTAAKIPIMEGYGLTETSPVICVNRFKEEGRMFGTVGPVIDGVEVKIAEDGEILCKGPNIMLGYYKDPQQTAEVMLGGWFHTGDIGMLIESDAGPYKQYLKITDRKKELFKTSGGKYVAPLPIESKLKESMYVEQIMVVGSERKFVGALIVPNFPQLKEWARQNGITEASNDLLIRNEKVKDLYVDLVESFNKYFNHVEQIKKFELLPQEWTIETGELTPKLSLKRKVIMEKYKDAVNRIYI